MNNEKINLPENFISKMKASLGDEYPLFEASFNDNQSKGVHLNTKFVDNETFENLGLGFEKLPYGSNLYKSSYEKIGSNPLSHAGIVYSQDPGAMMPVAGFKYPLPDRAIVLDMCSAPGGKTSQLVNMLDDTSIVIANEVNPARNKILQSNIERMGYKNVIVTKMYSEDIASYFHSAFDLILVDAPCSGEGMFRKYPESINEWSPENVIMCSERQRGIVSDVYNALKPGGYLIYSTCTYSKEENEDIVNFLISDFDMELMDVSEDIIPFSRSYMNDSNNPGRHFYPHISYGEGQYMCILRKKGELTKNSSYPIKLKALNSKELSLIGDALKNNKKLVMQNGIKYYSLNQSVIAIPDEIIIDNTLPFIIPNKSVERLFTIAGVFEKNRFTPHHNLFKAYSHLFDNKLDLEPDDDNLLKYLKGEEIYNESAANGYGVITCKNAPIGGYKASGGRLKNHYPKGLRNLN